MLGQIGLGFRLKLGQYHLRIWIGGFEYGNKFGGKVVHFIKSKKQLKQWIARKFFKSQLEDCCKIVIDSFSKDDYGTGFYNGIQFSFNALTGGAPDYLSVEEFKNKKGK